MCEESRMMGVGCFDVGGGFVGEWLVGFLVFWVCVGVLWGGWGLGVVCCWYCGGGGLCLCWLLVGVGVCDGVGGDWGVVVVGGVVLGLGLG